MTRTPYDPETFVDSGTPRESVGELRKSEPHLEVRIGKYQVRIEPGGWQAFEPEENTGKYVARLFYSWEGWIPCDDAPPIVLEVDEVVSLVDMLITTAELPEIWQTIHRPRDQVFYCRECGRKRTGHRGLRTGEGGSGMTDEADQQITEGDTVRHTRDLKAGYGSVDRIDDYRGQGGTISLDVSWEDGSRSSIIVELGTSTVRSIRRAHPSEIEAR